MIRTLIPLAALALFTAPGAAQGASSGQPSDDGWILLDGVAAQVGGKIVTMRDLDRAVRKEVESRFTDEPLSNQSELDRISWTNLEHMVVSLLESQAGEDMGIDPGQVSLLVERILADERRSIGAAAYVDGLIEDGQRALTIEELRARALYRELWRYAKLGFPGLGGTRPTRDRFIRPGELKMMYRANRDELRPDEVRLRVLVIPIAARGGVEETLAFLEDARRRIEDGDDMGDLVFENGADARDTRGLLDWMPIQALNHPGLRTFATDALRGDLSPILPLPPGGEPEAYVLAQLEERRDNDPPAFEERQVQRILRQFFMKERDDRILGFERALLSRDSHSWLHPGLRRLRDTASAQVPLPPR